MKTSNHLRPGRVYTRAQLREMFHISDNTINTGVFRPAGHDSVWLFVTEKKSDSQTQYLDHLDGDVLEWDGQTSGRTDHVIQNHCDLGLELLVFYRERAVQYPGAGFRYQGPFLYESHRPGHPSHFILRRAGPADRD